MSLETTDNLPKIQSQEVEILDWLSLELQISSYLWEFLLRQGQIQRIRSIQSKIINDIDNRIDFNDITSIHFSGRFISFELISNDGAKKEFCYDIFWEWENLLMTWNIHEAIQEKNHEMKANIDEFENYISLMEWIFQRNSQESSWDFKPWNGYIWKEDIVIEWADKWKHLVEMQSKARKALKKVGRSQIGFTSLSPKQRIRLAKIEETYLHMTMWVWDIYQPGWKAFAASVENEKEWAWRNVQEISVLMSRMILGRAPNIEKEWGIFHYYYRIHDMMNDAYAPDRTTKMVYEKLWKSLNAEIFDYISKEQKENPDKQEYYNGILLQFARMVSGRGTSKQYSWQRNEIYDAWAWYVWETWNKETRLNMWEDFYDPELASQILTQVMSQKWGLLEKLYSSWNIQIDDPEVWNTHPAEIVLWTMKLLQESLNIISRDENGKEVSREFLSEEWAKQYISQIVWETDIIWEAACYKDYGSMPLDLKVKISAIARLKNKLEVNQKKLQWGWHTKRNATRYTNENFWEILEEIIVDAFDDTMKSIENNFWLSWNWNFSKELKNMKDSQGNPIEFSKNEIEIFNVFHDIAGTGLFNLSDVNKWHAITWAKIAALLVVAFALTAATWWVAGAFWAWALSSNLIVQWTTMWLYAAPASWIIFPEGHTSTKEMLLDRWSDVLISGMTWAVWWVAAKWLWVEWAKMLSRWGMRNWSIFWADLYVLWIKTEQWRNQQIADYFHSDQIIWN